MGLIMKNGSCCLLLGIFIFVTMLSVVGVYALEEFEGVYFELCLDRECEDKQVLFELADEKAYVKGYDYEKGDISGSFSIIGEVERELMFDGNGIAEINFESAGVYFVSVRVEKEGYLSYTGSFSFEVVSEKGEIIDLTGMCDLDGECEADVGESAGNCPQDCVYGEETKKAGRLLGIGGIGWLIIAGLLIAILVVVIFIVVSYRKRKRNRSLNKLDKDVRGDERNRKVRV